MESLLSGMGALSLRPASLSSRAAVRGSPLVLRAARPAVAASVSFTVEAKQNSKKRVRQAEKTRMYNKSKKSEVATRIKKVLQAVAAAREGGATGAGLDTLLSEAYKVIDKACGKGILKPNTANRRKAMVARAHNSVAAAAPAAAAPATA